MVEWDMGRALCISIILLLITILITSYLALCTDNIDILRDEFMNVYRDVVSLARRGIDVSKLVHELSKVLDLINRGDSESLTKARSMLIDISNQVEMIKSRASNVILINNIIKYSTVASIISIPILFYFLFPRIYIALWFRIRRRWIIES